MLFNIIETIQNFLSWDIPPEQQVVIIETANQDSTSFNKFQERLQHPHTKLGQISSLLISTGAILCSLGLLCLIIGTTLDYLNI